MLPLQLRFIYGATESGPAFDDTVMLASSAKIVDDTTIPRQFHFSRRRYTSAHATGGMTTVCKRPDDVRDADW
jgi:hypothetical protein